MLDNVFVNGPILSEEKAFTQHTNHISIVLTANPRHVVLILFGCVCWAFHFFANPTSQCPYISLAFFNDPLLPHRGQSNVIPFPKQDCTLCFSELLQTKLLSFDTDCWHLLLVTLSFNLVQKASRRLKRPLHFNTLFRETQHRNLMLCFTNMHCSLGGVDSPPLTHLR